MILPGGLCGLYTILSGFAGRLTDGTIYDSLEPLRRARHEVPSALAAICPVSRKPRWRTLHIHVFDLAPPFKHEFRNFDIWPVLEAPAPRNSVESGIMDPHIRAFAGKANGMPVVSPILDTNSTYYRRTSGAYSPFSFEGECRCGLGDRSLLSRCQPVKGR